jgi:hypothetical protein
LYGKRIEKAPEAKYGASEANGGGGKIANKKEDRRGKEEGREGKPLRPRGRKMIMAVRPISQQLSV